MPNVSRGVTRHEGFRGDLGIAGNVLSVWLARLVDAGLLTRLPYRAERRPDPAHQDREDQL
jgi:hypothetical protein